MMSHWIYSAVVVAIASALLGLVVSGMVIRRVFDGHRPRPVISLLLVALLGLSLAQLIEQTRVLVFRSSFDGYIDASRFGTLYNSTWNVVSSKVLLAVSLAAAAALNLGLYCDKEDSLIVTWATVAAVGAVVAWMGLALILDVYI
jgi:hypothetical protein